MNSVENNQPGVETRGNFVDGREIEKKVQRRALTDDEARRLLEFAGKHPKDAAAIDALVLILQSPALSQSAGVDKTVAALMDHAADPRMAEVLQAVREFCELINVRINAADETVQLREHFRDVG